MLLCSVFYVYSTNRDNFHSTLISIAKAHIPGIAEIKKIGKGKILIEAMSANAANRIVENPSLNITFVLSFPAYKIFRSYSRSSN